MENKKEIAERIRQQVKDLNALIEEAEGIGLTVQIEKQSDFRTFIPDGETIQKNELIAKVTELTTY